MTCHCKSHNAEIGDIGEIVVVPPLKFRGREGFRESICIDSCMAPDISALWSADIWTLGCCCGHAGRVGGRNIIVESTDREAAVAIMQRFNFATRILAWEGEVLQ